MGLKTVRSGQLLEPHSKTLSHRPSVKAKSQAFDKIDLRRNMDTKWVQIAPVSTSFGPACVVSHKDSESGLQMAGKGCKGPTKANIPYVLVGPC